MLRIRASSSNASSGHAQLITAFRRASFGNAPSSSSATNVVEDAHRGVVSWEAAVLAGLAAEVSFFRDSFAGSGPSRNQAMGH